MKQGDLRHSGAMSSVANSGTNFHWLHGMGKQKLEDVVGKKKYLNVSI